jgi:hypothetical protein
MTSLILALLACSGGGSTTPTTTPTTRTLSAPTSPAPTSPAPTTPTDTDTTSAATDSVTTGDTAAVDEPARTVELFGPTPHPALRIVLHQQLGDDPDPTALDLFRGALSDLEDSGHLVKPGGVSVEAGEVLPAPSTPGGDHSFSDLDLLLESARGPYVQGDAAVVHVLYADGRFDHGGPGTVLGFAYGGAKVVVMRDAVDAACDETAFDLLPGPLADEACETLEAALLLHELGHLFGLVDNGLPMVADHLDPDHGAHDVSDDCLMYWAAETPEYTQTLADRFLRGETGVPTFDDECLADMAAALP